MMFTPFIQELLTAASDIALTHFGKVTATVKPGDNNQVLTEADMAVGAYIVTAIRERFPDHTIIDEEAGVIDNDSRYTWVIDPIDGTANFAAGLPYYGIMIGLLEDATPIAGGIVNPSLNKMYVAEKGHGATCNGEPIHVTGEQTLSNTLVSFGVDGLADNPAKNQQQCAVLADMLPKIRNMRNSGSEAIDPMLVAEGKYGGRIDVYAKIWDVVAPQIICEEAGAIWTTANGEAVDYSRPTTRAEQNFTFCVAPAAIHQQLLAIIAHRLDA